MKIILKESQIKGLIRTTIKEQTDGEYYEISASDYMTLMKLASYESKVTGIKKFKGKPLYVIGNVDLSSTPATSLGNVATITGNLDISNSKIANLSKTDVRGSIRDDGSEREKIRIRKEEMKKLADADERREDGEWDLDNPNIDEKGLAANALFNILVNDGDLTEMDEDTNTELESKKERLKELEERYEGSLFRLEPEEVSLLADEISNLETEIEELQSNYTDVYYLQPLGGGNELHYFEVIGLRGREYMVGRYDDVYDAAIEREEELLVDVGLEGLPSWLISNNIDKNQVREQMRDFYESDISESPESYFTEGDFELTTEQEERKEQLETYIFEMEDLKTEKEEELEGFGEDDEPYEMDIRKFLEKNSDKTKIELTKLIDVFVKENDTSVDRVRKFQRILKLENIIEDIEEKIDKAQEELDSIEPDTEPTYEMIEEKVKDYIRNTEEVEWLTEMGYDLADFVNVTDVARDIVERDGIEVFNYYDGRYDDTTIKTTDGKPHNFVIMRFN